MDPPATVLDIGSGSPKIGLAGNAEPFFGNGGLVVPACNEEHPYFAKSPFVDGRVEDWDCMEDVLIRLHMDSSIECDAHPDCLTGSKTAMSENAMQMFAEIFFETMNVPALYITDNALFSLVAPWTSIKVSNRSMNGLVVDIGHSTTTLSCFVEGVCAYQKSILLGGRDATAVVHKQMRQKNQTPVALWEAERAKEQYSYTCKYIEKGIPKYIEEPERYTKNFSSSSGAIFELKHERFMGSETFFEHRLCAEVLGAISSLLLVSRLACAVTWFLEVDPHFFGISTGGLNGT
jgi:actin-related protein 3